MNIDLSVLKSAPDFSASGVLSIEALAPLSLVSKMPGAYYRSLAAPSDWMLFGLLENALGWHFEPQIRETLWQKLLKRHKQDKNQSGVGFVSLLQHHVRLELTKQPPVLRYDDVWIQHLRKRDGSHIGGSRHHDRNAIAFSNALASKDVSIGDRNPPGKPEEAFKNNASLINDWEDKEKVHYNVLLPYYPRYYSSNRTREYIVVHRPYKWSLKTSPQLFAVLQSALETPEAPLYLGANDGWVEAQLEEINV